MGLNIQANLATFIANAGTIGKSLQSAVPYLFYLKMSHDAVNTVNYISNLDFTPNPETGKKIGKAFANIMDEVAESSSGNFDKLAVAGSMTVLKRWVPTLIVMGLATSALPLIYTYIQKVLIHNIGKPPLALKQHKITMFNTLTSMINPFATKPETITKPIFNQKVENQIQDIVKATNNIRKNNAFFQNVILYGPGGTGKTMIAEKIAKEAGMNYFMMSGGELGQFIKRGEHVTELNKLLDIAEKSSNPSIIFIDEAEGLCKKRADLDQERLELQNTLLNRSGTPSKKVMFILATNRIADIDQAILNRMTHKIHIDVPGLEERTQIIDLYAKQFFKDEELNQFFNATAVKKIAEKTEKLSGRSLFYIINMLFAKKCGTDDNKLSQSIVDQTVDDFVEQEKNIELTV